MLYINDILFRFFYISISAIILFCIFFFKKEILLSLLLTLITFDERLRVNSIIYTSPIEMFQIYLLLVLLFLCISLLPYIYWQFIDFLSPGIQFIEYQKLIRLLLLSIFFLIITNSINFYFIIPRLWAFIHIFSGTSFLLSFELRILDFFNFIVYLSFLFNGILCFLMVFYLFILQLSSLLLVRLKKFFNFCNIVFGTLLSPPDIVGQVTLILLMNSFFHFCLVSSIFSLKIRKFNKVVN